MSKRKPAADLSPAPDANTPAPDAAPAAQGDETEQVPAGAETAESATPAAIQADAAITSADQDEAATPEAGVQHAARPALKPITEAERLAKRGKAHGVLVETPAFLRREPAPEPTENPAGMRNPHIDPAQYGPLVTGD